MPKRIEFPVQIGILDRLRNPNLIRDEQERRAIEDASELRDAYLFSATAWDHRLPRMQLIAMKRAANLSDHDLCRIGKAEALLVSRKGVHIKTWNAAGIIATFLVCFCAYQLVIVAVSALQHHSISARTAGWGFLAIVLLAIEAWLIVKPWAIFCVALMRASPWKPRPASQ